MTPATLLIVGHGTRDPVGHAQFQQLVERHREARPERRVAGCFLELQRPTIAEAIERLIEQGAEAIELAPALLFAAGHALRDVPAEIEAARRRHPGVSFTQADVLGCRPDVLELSARRFDEALAGAPPLDAGQTALVLVGRGSLEPSATTEMQRFARLRCQMRPVGRCEAAFLAMAEPRVEAALDAVGRGGHRRVVVQPHLLFTGELSLRLAGLVESAAAAYPAVDWRATDVLGPEILLG